MTEIPTEPDYQAFMEALSSLTREYGVRIGGCGCCGSPFLMPLEYGEERGNYEADAKNDNLKWHPA